MLEVWLGTLTHAKGSQQGKPGNWQSLKVGVKCSWSCLGVVRAP